MKGEKSVRIEFSVAALLKITAFAVGLLFFWTIRRVLLILFVAFIIMSAFSPIVKWFEKKRLPKSLAIGLIYVSSISLLAGLVFLIIFPLISQLGMLFTQLPVVISSFVDKFDFLREWYFANGVDDYLMNISGELARQAIGLGGSVFDIFRQALGVVGTLLGFISVIILSLYMLVEHDRALPALLELVPFGNREKVFKIISKIELQLGKWLRGQIILSLIVGSMVWIVLTVLKVQFALPLAILAGILEIVPNIGPFLSVLPAWLLVIGGGNLFQIIAIPVSYWVIQQLENNYIVPQIMRKAVGLNPIVTMVAFLIGAEIAGVPGVLLAVPTAAILQIVVKELR